MGPRPHDAEDSQQSYEHQQNSQTRKGVQHPLQLHESNTSDEAEHCQSDSNDEKQHVEAPEASLSRLDIILELLLVGTVVVIIKTTILELIVVTAALHVRFVENCMTHDNLFIVAMISH